MNRLDNQSSRYPIGRRFCPPAALSRRTPDHVLSETPEATDAELIRRISQGDREAFASFYDRHSGLLFGMVFNIILDAKLAEDVLQEAFLHIWDKARLFDPQLGNPLSWAVTLTRNKAIDHFRASQRRQKLIQNATESLFEMVEAGPTSEDHVTAGERAAAVRRVLMELPHDQRHAIELAFFRGMTQTEIAKSLGEPLGTIKARIRRGMLKLRDSLEGTL